MKIQQYSNFLTKEECKILIDIIDKNNIESLVTGGFKGSIKNQSRTSRTCMMDPNDSLIKSIHEKIAYKIGLDVHYGETLQGQKYEVGQYFKPHHDYFTGDNYLSEAQVSGNRIKTFMIYLNDDFEGGGTDFPLLGVTIKAEAGKAVLWNDMEDGKLVEESLHEGCTITKGKKYIITSWWRENRWDAIGDKTAIKTPKEELNVNIISNKNDDNNQIYTERNLPRLTEKGFKVVKCPQETWDLVKWTYDKIKDERIEEMYDNKESHINGIGVSSEIINIHAVPNFKKSIHEQLYETHKEFCGVDIIPSYIYGIRSYLKHATLKMHTDRVNTHHISSILIVDKDLDGNPDWSLDIVSHDGKLNKIYAEVGDLILYESAVCSHGRPDKYQGNWFRNMFIHYQFKNFKQ
jgi:prolyl 4-hydroxylase